jgi:hypothetical protein
MKLYYRGLPYESTAPKIDAIDTGISAKFLGQQYSIRRPVNLQSSQPTAVLKFRGNSYPANVALTRPIEPFTQSLLNFSAEHNY